jgi:hypothetical protein
MRRTLAKLRCRIERDYQELKQEVGLGHFEGRGWRGFHHHATHCGLRLPHLRAGDDSPLTTLFRRAVRDAWPIRRFSTRGAAIAPRAPRAKFDRNHAPPSDRCAGENTATLSMLLSTDDKTHATQEFVMR